MVPSNLDHLDRLKIDPSARSAKPPARHRVMAIAGVSVAVLLLVISITLAVGGLPGSDERSEPAHVTSPERAGEQTAADQGPSPPAGSSGHPPDDEGDSSAGAFRSGTPVLNATGYVVARRAATVSATTTGKVVEVLIEEGMTVTKGQVLARLDDRMERAELALAEAQLDAARLVVDEMDAQLEKIELELARAGSLAERQLVSQSSIDNLVLDGAAMRARSGRAQREIVVAERRVSVQRQRLTELEIRAPFAGVVVDKTAQPGEMISPMSSGGFTRTGIATVVDMNSLEVEVDVNEAYIQRVRRGQPVEITLNAYPDEPYRGSVLTVIPTAERSTATIRVRIGFTDDNANVLPEMGVQVAFFTKGDQL